MFQLMRMLLFFSPCLFPPLCLFVYDVCFVCIFYVISPTCWCTYLVMMLRLVSPTIALRHYGSCTYSHLMHVVMLLQWFCTSITYMLLFLFVVNTFPPFCRGAILCRIFIAPLPILRLLLRPMTCMVTLRPWR